MTFKLGTFQNKEGLVFLGLVHDDSVFNVEKAELELVNQKSSSVIIGAGTLLDALESWDHSFEALQRISAAIFESKVGAGGTLISYEIEELKVLPPIRRPSKILNSAANYNAHLAEMRAYTQTGGQVDPQKIFSGDKTNSKPYLFLKSPSSLIGAYDNIVIPKGNIKVDWEAELAVVIGRRGRRISSSNAMSHVAGFMTFNDVSSRTTLFREDRPNFRTDWLSSKSFDTFAPSGPFFVPRAFIPSHKSLWIRLWVNGDLKQDGLAGDMIFSPEEQIEFASAVMTLEPGDIFVTGTVGGVGQGGNVFLRAGDVIETEVQSLGRQRNGIVDET